MGAKSEEIKSSSSSRAKQQNTIIILIMVWVSCSGLDNDRKPLQCLEHTLYNWFQPVKTPPSVHSPLIPEVEFLRDPRNPAWWSVCVCRHVGAPVCRCNSSRAHLSGKGNGWVKWTNYKAVMYSSIFRSNHRLNRYWLGLRRKEKEKHGPSIHPQCFRQVGINIWLWGSIYRGL